MATDSENIIITKTKRETKHWLLKIYIRENDENQ